MKKWLADTLFKRLFLLMWVALVMSHVAGVFTSHHLTDTWAGGTASSRPPEEVQGPGLPPPLLPLPARVDPWADGPAAGAPSFGAALRTLWLDYLVRLLVIGGAAWFGARWLSRPMRRLADASRALAQSLATRQPYTPLREDRGTLEVQRTADVFNTMAAQLQQQFEAQGLMMAAISHDLRTPLTRLRMRLEQMEPGALKERCAADVQEADRMIASVLEALRLSHQSAPLQRVDLRALLNSAVDDMAEQGHDVALEILPLETASVVLADASALQRVVGNLVGNALRHGGSARLALGEHGEQLVVRIDDHGPGIPEHELDAVFRPFYRLDPARRADTGGAGLGLYIARDLVQRFGGTLVLANRREGGLRAELRLPRVR